MEALFLTIILFATTESNPTLTKLLVLETFPIVFQLFDDMLISSLTEYI